MDDSDVFPPGGEDDVDGPVPDPFKINQMMDDDDAQPPMPPSGAWVDPPSCRSFAGSRWSGWSTAHMTFDGRRLHPCRRALTSPSFFCPPGGDGPDLQSNMLDPDEDDEDEEEQHETLPLFANQAARELHAEILKHKEHVEQHDKALSDHKEGCVRLAAIPG